MMPISCRRLLPALWVALALLLPGELWAGEPSRLSGDWQHPTVVPMARVSVGAGLLFGAERFETSEMVHVSLGASLFAVDGNNTLDKFYGGSLWLAPEIGYDYLGFGQRGGHTGSIGLGVGYGNLLLMNGMYSARFVVGAIDGKVGGGFRHGISANFLFTFFTLEIAHQVLHAGGITTNDVQFLLGINPGAFGLFAIGLD